jgi:thiol:disulfide interchange protein
VKVRLNFSTVGAEQQALLDTYGVLGLPAVLFLRSDGSEIEGLRVIEFINPDAFLLVLKKAKA